MPWPNIHGMRQQGHADRFPIRILANAANLFAVMQACEAAHRCTCTHLPGKQSASAFAPGSRGQHTLTALLSLGCECNARRSMGNPPDDCLSLQLCGNTSWQPFTPQEQRAAALDPAPATPQRAAAAQAGAAAAAGPASGQAAAAGGDTPAAAPLGAPRPAAQEAATAARVSATPTPAAAASPGVAPPAVTAASDTVLPAAAASPAATQQPADVAAAAAALAAATSMPTAAGTTAAELAADVPAEPLGSAEAQLPPPEAAAGSKVPDIQAIAALLVAAAPAAGVSAAQIALPRPGSPPAGTEPTGTLLMDIMAASNAAAELLPQPAEQPAEQPAVKPVQLTEQPISQAQQSAGMAVVDNAGIAADGASAASDSLTASKAVPDAKPASAPPEAPGAVGSVLTAHPAPPSETFTSEVCSPSESLVPLGSLHLQSHSLCGDVFPA